MERFSEMYPGPTEDIEIAHSRAKAEGIYHEKLQERAGKASSNALKKHEAFRDQLAEELEKNKNTEQSISNEQLLQKAIEADIQAILQKTEESLRRFYKTREKVMLEKMADSNFSQLDSTQQARAVTEELIQGKVQGSVKRFEGEWKQSFQRIGDIIEEGIRAERKV